tara:strand:- start:75 stop:614 length:540 start_codon:yes stop_codon:yes gene_type:complete
MSWQLEIPIIVRVWINDLEDKPTYSDDRIQQVIAVAAQNVVREINLNEEYTIDVVNLTITPDPCLASDKDNDFIALTALKSACILDQSTFRTKAVNEGIKSSLGPTTLHVQGNLKGYQTLLETGPCAIYSQLRTEFEVGNPNTCQAVLSPFIGNKFDPRNTSAGRGPYRSNHYIDKFYS